MRIEGGGRERERERETERQRERQRDRETERETERERESVCACACVRACVRLCVCADVELTALTALKEEISAGEFVPVARWGRIMGVKTFSVEEMATSGAVPSASSRPCAPFP